ncbi:MAG: hypothetical protein KGJ07_00510 [Patescibacteria group bacterium]|nr:hypothetical protein [Patescibacteria group bacterium]
MGKKFDKLEKHIENEYLKKGFSHLKAHEIGEATAAKVAREKQAKGR